MALTITHTKVATLPDQPGVEVNAGEWNDDHIVTGSLGEALNGITAATAAVTIASGNNTGIVWNWAITTDSTGAWTIGETTASTGGTSTSGIPNQFLAKFITLAASTASPLTVYSRGAHVFSVSPTTAQILATDGTLANPAYAFAGAVGTGMYRASSAVSFAYAGVFIGRFSNAVGAPQLLMADGLNFGVPQISENAGASTGLTFSSGSIAGIATAGVENVRWTIGLSQLSKGTADAVSYVIQGDKSRGTVASPAVITTGDKLLIVKGRGYVGATNTKQDGASIHFTTSGTVSDAANGFAKSLEIWTGTATVASALSWSIEPDGFMKFTKGIVANGVNAVTPPTTLGPAVLAVQEWIQCYNAAGTLRYMPLYG